MSLRGKNLPIPAHIHRKKVYSHASLREKQEVSLLLDVAEDLFCKAFQWRSLQEKRTTS